MSAGESRDGDRVRVAVVGMGAIGGAAAAECVESDDLELVAQVDPARAGETANGLEIVASLAELPDATDVAMLCTSSSVRSVAADLEALVGAGVHVVSSCEELTFPWLGDPATASALDATAQAAGRTILGCGVNPGFVMDVLPVLAASAGLRPRTVTVRREANLARRRPQLQRKVGVGLDPDEWQRLQDEDGRFGHWGLVESALVVAVGLGWTPAATSFTRRPLSRDGAVTGIEEVAQVDCEQQRSVTLTLHFEMHGPDEDRIEIDGLPALALVAEDGIQGDHATVARLLSSARVVGGMPPGLRLPLEAPLWWRRPSFSFESATLQAATRSA